MTGEKQARTSRRAQWEEQYASDVTPWDTQITPPEVQDFWRAGRLPATGLALDIGCGPGTNVRFLAEQGLTAIGVDIALQPLLTGAARIRRHTPQLADRAQFIQADVTRLPLTGAGARYIVDIGCFHGVDPNQRATYVDGIVANLGDGGYYQLYAFDHTPEMAQDPDRKLLGLGATEVRDRFAGRLTVVEMVRATPERYPCRWYLLQKK